MNLSDKDPVTPFKKTINTITINKEDYKKLTAKANTYDNFQEQMQIQKQCELQVKKEFNEAKKR